MLSKVHKPKSKQDLIRALQLAPIKSFEIYEGSGISKLPSKNDLIRKENVLIVIS